MLHWSGCRKRVDRFSMRPAAALQNYAGRWRCSFLDENAGSLLEKPALADFTLTPAAGALYRLGLVWDPTRFFRFWERAAWGGVEGTRHAPEPVGRHQDEPRPNH